MDQCNPMTGCMNTAVNCNDNDVCTMDYCSRDVGCVHVPIGYGFSPLGGRERGRNVGKEGYRSMYIYDRLIMINIYWFFF